MDVSGELRTSRRPPQQHVTLLNTDWRQPINSPRSLEAIKRCGRSPEELLLPETESFHESLLQYSRDSKKADEDGGFTPRRFGRMADYLTALREAAIKQCQEVYQDMLEREEKTLARTQLLRAGSAILAKTQNTKTARPPAEVERAAMKAVANKMRENLTFQIERDAQVEVRAQAERKRRDEAARDEEIRLKEVAQSQAAFKATVAKQKQARAAAQKDRQKQYLAEYIEKLQKSDETILKFRQKQEEEKMERRWKDPDTKKPRPKLTMDQIRARHADQKEKLRAQYSELHDELNHKFDKAATLRHDKATGTPHVFLFGFDINPESLRQIEGKYLELVQWWKDEIIAKNKAAGSDSQKERTKKFLSDFIDEMQILDEDALLSKQRDEVRRMERRWKDPDPKKPRPKLTMDQIEERHAKQESNLQEQYAELQVALSAKFDKAIALRSDADISAENVKKVEAKFLECVQRWKDELETMQAAAKANREAIMGKRVSELQDRARKREQKMKEVAQKQEAERKKAEQRAAELKQIADEKAEKALHLIEETHTVDPILPMMRSLRLANVEDAVQRQKREDALRRKRLEQKLDSTMRRLEKKEAKKAAAQRHRARVAHKVMLEKHRNADKLYQLNITNNIAKLKAQLKEHESDEEAED